MKENDQVLHIFEPLIIWHRKKNFLILGVSEFNNLPLPGSPINLPSRCTPELYLTCFGLTHRYSTETISFCPLYLWVLKDQYLQGAFLFSYILGGRQTLTQSITSTKAFFIYVFMNRFNM